MRLSIIAEATTKWIGPLHNTLGDGSDWSVNYGTADKTRPPMLYFQIPLKFIRSAIRKVAKSLLIWAEDTSISGDYINVSNMPKQQINNIINGIYRTNPNTEVYLYPELTHVGEAHITITMGAELSNCIDDLKRKFSVDKDVEALQLVKVNGKPLFSNKIGLKAEFNVEQDELYKVFRAAFYSDKVDPSGPMLVALNISTDAYSDIRQALGLSPTFMIPGKNIPWSPHVTLGYIPKGNNILDDWRPQI